MYLNKKKAFLLIGAVLNAFPLSLLMYFGNLLPYIASFFYAHRNEMTLYIDPLWISSVFACTYSLSMIVTSPIEHMFGMRRSFIVFNIFLCISVLSGYFTVREPLALTLMSGGVQGFSDGVLYTMSLKMLIQEMHDQEGMAVGAMIGGSVIGGLLNIGVAFVVINPSNKEPDINIGNRMYFSDQDLLESVPVYFLVTGVMTMLTTGIGTGLIFMASSEPYQIIQPDTQSCASTIKKQNGNENKFLLPTGKGNNVPLLKDALAHEYNSIITKVEQDIQKGFEDSYFSSDGKGMVEQGSDDSNDTENMLNIQKVSRCTELQVHPKKVIKSARFWCLWVSFMASSHTRYLLLNMYKEYGQQIISNDSMLVVTGLISMAIVIFTQPLVGIISDKFGIRFTAIAFNASSCVLMCLMVIVIRASPLSYMIFVVLENLSVAPQVLLFSILATTEFGKTHFASNMGLICSGNVILILLEPFFVSATVSSLGWDWLFLSGSAAATIAILTIMAMNWFERA